jgi:IclR family transcriptional regulator, acetate operon repressor
MGQFCMTEAKGKAEMTRPPIQNKKDEGGMQVISRAVSIVRTLSTHPNGLSLGEIAKQVGLARSTVQRIVAALAHEMLVESVGPAGGFRIGPALGQIVYQTLTDVLNIARPHLEKLSANVQETVCFVRRHGEYVYTLEQVIPLQSLRVVVPTNAPLPAGLTASGKSLLALEDDVYVEYLLKETKPPFNFSNRSVERFLTELAEIREGQFALDIEQTAKGICAISLAIRTYRGPFSITLVVPTSRMQDKLDSFKAALMLAKQNIEALVGIPSLVTIKCAS